MTTEWRHNDADRQWEYGYYDLAYDKFIVGAFVTDEMIERVAVPAAVAGQLMRSVGSVPPPLREHAPAPAPEPPIRYEAWEAEA